MVLSIIVYTTKQKDRFPSSLLPCFGCCHTAHFVLQPGRHSALCSHHTTQAAHQGCTGPLPGSRGMAWSKGLRFKILGARLLLFQSKQYRLELKKRSEQQIVVCITNFALNVIISERQSYLTKFFSCISLAIVYFWQFIKTGFQFKDSQQNALAATSLVLPSQRFEVICH